MNPEFFEKINPAFLSLTNAILCYALRCWETGLFIAEVHLRRSSARSKPLLIMVRRGDPLIS